MVKKSRRMKDENDGSEVAPFDAIHCRIFAYARR